MTENFFDIRMFGAVMTTAVNAGQVRGPIQLTFARSVEPVVPLDLSITRKAVTREEDRTVAVSDEGEGTSGKQSEMGRKALVPYGLYRAHGFFNPHFALQTGANTDDLALLWEALQRMFDIDRSASRGMMAMQAIYVFSHENPLGDAPAHKLFERVRVIPVHEGRAARTIHDYRIEVDPTLPDGVHLTRVIEPGT
jgi:CRISPR-associated protein Csd2